MIKVIFFDAGGVLLLNENGVAAINKSIIRFIEANNREYNFGILSSTSLALEDIIAGYGLRDRFTLIQTSGDSHIDKDDPRFFTQAIKSLGVRVDEAVLIDNDEDFIKAAQKAGMHTIAYTRSLDLGAAVSELITS